MIHVFMDMGSLLGSIGAVNNIQWCIQNGGFVQTDFSLDIAHVCVDALFKFSSNFNFYLHWWESLSIENCEQERDMYKGVCQFAL